MYLILSHQKLLNYMHIQGAKDSNNILSPIDIIHYRKSHQSTVREPIGLHPPQANVQSDKHNNMRDTIQFQPKQITDSSGGDYCTQSQVICSYQTNRQLLKESTKQNTKHAFLLDKTREPFDLFATALQPER